MSKQRSLNKPIFLLLCAPLIGYVPTQLDLINSKINLIAACTNDTFYIPREHDLIYGLSFVGNIVLVHRSRPVLEPRKMKMYIKNDRINVRISEYTDRVLCHYNK